MAGEECAKGLGWRLHPTQARRATDAGNVVSPCDCFGEERGEGVHLSLTASVTCGIYPVLLVPPLPGLNYPPHTSAAAHSAPRAL